ncbi:hypothetical protein [Oceanobacillus neutriphilus]|uniref:Uncharacterized protein n=1 Tax=Oceanobacillus neutriphilus TaxID=531815 RepID=A0ABQ2P0G3_9BACI|nr:hypothetical protein [Oceanobacillus neutriphilus]GGP15022.1 hypothetical protein GCM10011346_41360 [Oceanobacillus neutriphilus]
MNHVKRYLTIYIALIFISVIIIGFYLVDKEEVDFNWKTVSGDEETVKDVLIYGDAQRSTYSPYYNIVPDPFRLSLEDSKRIELQRGMYYGWYYQDSQMEKYVKEYKSFMRGKNAWSENFIETENQLIYVDGDNLGWGIDESNDIHVEILDKETDEVNAFELPVEENQQIYGVNSISINDNKLYAQVYMEGQYNQAADIYQDDDAILIIDLNNQTIEDIKFPSKDIEPKEDIYTTLIYQDSGLINGEMNYLYIYDEYKVDQNGGYIGDSSLKYELRLYNVEEDSFKSVDLLGDSLYEGEFLRIYDGEVYAGLLQGENYSLTRFDENLEEKEVIFDENVLNGDSEIIPEDVYPLTDIRNGYFYIAFPAFSNLTATDVSINAFDLETGENVYQGIIQAADSMKQYQYFNLNQMEFEDE